ncbi:site-specific integrase [Mycobacteroides abscessus]|uniref:tyrosine-type recombinase/integrase n=1 Tax=Mycobacteroides abscessus TaxID=36809 RepID=UPI000C26A3A3|nr:tyrosine-type recombinase/integrase [Mycobacteroides abscessus]AWG65277.1 site-specific integrase [Mycobacteroides abscessus]
MAYIRKHETKQRARGRAVYTYAVVWRANINGTVRPRQRSFATRELAEEYLPTAAASERTTHTTDPAELRRLGERTLAEYSADWVAAQQLKVSTNRLKQSTLDGYALLLRAYVLPKCGHLPIASITVTDIERALSSLITSTPRTRGATLSPGTVRQVWNVMRRVFVYAMQHDAITTNPIDRVDFSANRSRGDDDGFTPHPLTSDQVAALCAALAGQLPDPKGNPLPAYPVYSLMVEFAAYTGLRKGELAGLTVSDLTFSPVPAGALAKASVRVERAAIRKGGQWTTGTLKSARSRRTVPLPGWLAVKMADYLTDTHPRGNEADAPLWPGRTNAGGHRDGRGAGKGARRAMALDWSQPIDLSTFSRRILAPALVAARLPVSTPARQARTLRDGSVIPAVDAIKGVRFHDLRHTFAVAQLSAGVNFMQVSKWLGHATFTVTLDIYGDYINPEGEVNALPAPVAANVVVPLRARSS